MKKISRSILALFACVIFSVSYSQSRKPVYSPCILKDSVEGKLEFIKLNASRIFMDTFDCRQTLFDSIASKYIDTRDKKYLDALAYIRNSSAASKVEDLYTDVIRSLIKHDFSDLLSQLYQAKGKYIALEKELIATMNMIIEGRPYKQKYMGLLNLEISKARDKNDAARVAYLEKLKNRIEEDSY